MVICAVGGTRGNHYFVRVTGGNHFFVRVTSGNHYFVRVTRFNYDCMRDEGLGNDNDQEMLFFRGGGLNNC